MAKLLWTTRGCGWQAEPESDVTLYVTPERNKFGKPAHGTPWRAGVLQWDEKTRTVSRYGEDIYPQLFKNRQAAMRAAEQVYVAERTRRYNP